MLFHEIIFGPIESRRFGTSLGINLLPLDNKICNFNCIYCECGWTDLRAVDSKFFPEKHIVDAMEKRFSEISQEEKKPQAITFAGNGEPTMHPAFDRIIEKTVELRDKYLPGIKIVVLSNAALLSNKKVFNALAKADLRVMKLDAGSEELFQLIDQPLSLKKLNDYVEKLREFNGKLSIQTIFLKGRYKNVYIDNTSDAEVDKWIGLLKKIRPESVMIYTIDRATPAQELEKITEEKLNEICRKVTDAGINAKVYY